MKASEATAGWLGGFLASTLGGLASVMGFLRKLARLDPAARWDCSAIVAPPPLGPRPGPDRGLAGRGAGYRALGGNDWNKICTPTPGYSLETKRGDMATSACLDRVFALFRLALCSPPTPMTTTPEVV